MTEAQIKSVALFFFFAFLDDRLASKAASQVVKQISRIHHKNPKMSDEDVAASIVRLTHDAFLKNKKFAALGMSGLASERGWKTPPKLDLGPWKEFQRRAQSEDLLALIWSRILGFSENAIAKGLGVSAGTITYRVSNSLKSLGQLAYLDERRL